MYDEYAKRLIDLIPDLPEIDRDACRRALSIVYFYIIRSQLGIAENDNTTPNLDSSRLLLRRMADTLESIAVFDRLYGQAQPTEIENACAFVAAESLALLATSLPPIDSKLIGDALLSEANYTSIESALLYMIGGYDSNAASIVRNIKIPEISVQDFDSITHVRQVNAIYVLSSIISLCQSDVRRPRQYSNLTLNNTELPGDYDTLLSEIRARLYLLLRESVLLLMGTMCYRKTLPTIFKTGLEVIIIVPGTRSYGLRHSNMLMNAYLVQVKIQ